MCNKKILLDVLNKIENVSYGNDYIFSSILKNNHIDILHIDNQVVIENIDENEIFINKTEKALENLIKNYKNNKIKRHSISILNAYVLLELFFLKTIFIKITDLIKNILKNNLSNHNPNLFLFDLYRLRYLCKVKDF